MLHPGQVLRGSLPLLSPTKQNTSNKIKVIPVHAMKAYIGSRGTDPLVINIGAGWRSVVNITPGSIYLQKGTPLLIVQDPGMAPEPLRKFCRKENF
jgi:hypothetical protein